MKAGAVVPLLVSGVGFTLVNAGAEVLAPAFPASHQAAGCEACHTDFSADGGLPPSAAHCADCHDAMPGTTESSPQMLAAAVPVVVDLPEVARPGAEPGPMVLIPAGEFLMGTDERLSDEGPPHRVWLDDYRIDVFEVTNR